MRYKLVKSSDTTQIEVIGSNWQDKIKFTILALIGLPFSLFSLALLSPGRNSVASGLTAGLGFGLLGYSLYRLFAKSKPAKLIFDNAKEALLIKESRLSWNSPELPYSEIQGFIKLDKKICMKKKDGSRWIMWKEDSKEAADDSLSYMKQHILLPENDENEPRQPYNPKLSNAISVTQDQNGTTLRWRSGGRVLSRFGQLLMLLVIPVILVGALFSRFSSHKITLSILGPILWIGLIALGGVGFVYFVAGLLSWTTVQVNDKLITVKQGRFNLPMLHFAMPSPAIEAVVLHWNPTLEGSATQPNEDVILLKAAKNYNLESDDKGDEPRPKPEEKDEDDELIEELEDIANRIGHLDSVLGIVKELEISLGQKRINVDDLSLSDRVALEYKLQELVEQYTNQRPA